MLEEPVTEYAIECFVREGHVERVRLDERQRSASGGSLLCLVVLRDEQCLACDIERDALVTMVCEINQDAGCPAAVLEDSTACRDGLLHQPKHRLGLQRLEAIPLRARRVSREDERSRPLLAAPLATEVFGTASAPRA